MGRRLLVVGGDAAGMSAAALARRRDADLEVVVVERTRFTSYSACGLPALVAGTLRGPEDLVLRRPDEFRAARIDVRTEHEVTGLDLAAGRAEVHNLTHGRTFALGFDLLVLATGARPRSPGIPGEDSPQVHGIRTLEDGVRMLDDLRRRRPASAVVVGGDYTGLQVAEALAQRGAAVTVVVPEEEVLADGDINFDADLAAKVSAAARAGGVSVELGARVEAVEEGAVQLAGGRSVPAEVLILACGTEPNTGLAEGGSIRVGPTGGIVVDRRQASSADGVWAAGDCCETRHLLSGRPVRHPTGAAANRQGRVAGVNATGGYASYPGVLGAFTARLFGVEVGRVGLEAAEAAACGFEVDSVTVTGTSAEEWTGAARPVTLRLAAERGSGRLLGLQAAGGAGAARSVEAVASALAGRLTAEDLVGLDLPHAPWSAPVADPLQVAARLLASGDRGAASRL